MVGDRHEAFGRVAVGPIVDDDDDDEVLALPVPECVRVHPEALWADVEEFSQVLAYETSMLAALAQDLAVAKVTYTAEYAKLRQRARAAAKLVHTRPPKDEIDDEVHATSAYREIAVALATAQAAHLAQKAVVTGLESKGRMLDLLGRRAIAEIRADPNAGLAAVGRRNY